MTETAETTQPALTDENGLRAAYRAHGGELYGFASRILDDRGLAEEAVQETFLRAWRAAERFDPDRGSLRTWLFSILRNVVVDQSRARARRPPVASEGSGIEREEDPWEHAILGWQVEGALRRISENHRRILVEVYYRGRGYRDVASDLQIPEGTVKSRVYHALRALRAALEEMGWSDG